MNASADLLSLALTPWSWQAKTKNASANTPMLESRVFHRSSFFDECLSYFAQFGFDPPGPGRQKRGMLQLISSFWNVEFFIEAHLLMDASATLLSLAWTPLVPVGKIREMLQLVSSFWKVEFFIEAHFLMNASADLLSLALKPFSRHAKKRGML